MPRPQRFTVDQIIDALRKGGSEEKAGQLLGATRWAIYRTIRRLEREGKLPADILQRRQANRRLPGKVGPIDEFKPPSIEEQLQERADRADQRGTAQRLKMALDEVERLGGAVNNLTKIDKIIREYKIKPPGLNKYHKNESVMVAMLSDVHLGQIIDKHRSGGKEEYNLDVCRHRLERYYTQLPKLAKDVSGRTSVKRCLVHPMLGDMIHGNLHEPQPGTVWGTPHEQINHLLPILRAGLQYLLDSKQFDRIVIPCCVGNHSRTTEKNEWEKPVETNFEWGLYLRLKEYFEARDEKRIEVYPPISYFNTFELPGGDTIRMQHGQAWRYKDGVGGITIPLVKYIDKCNRTAEVMSSVRAKLRLHAPLIDLMGDKHTYLHIPGAIVNGAVVGVGGYAQSLGITYSTPKQAVFVLHPDYGITYMLPVVFG